MPIEQLAVIPSRYRPTTYTEDMEAFLAWLQRNVPNYNALEQSLQLVATTGTSSSTLTVGTGVRDLTAPAGKAWAVGSWVILAYAAGVSNLMLGQITAYNSGTGAMTVDVKSATGSGTYSSWVISLGAARGGSETFSGTVYASRFEVDSGFALYLSGGVSTIILDTNDLLRFTRSTNTFDVVIGGTTEFSVTANGPERTDDATTANSLPRKSQLDSATAQATTSARGTMQIASAAEASSGADDTKALTPAKLRSGVNASGSAPIYAPRAWANFTPSGAINSSGNVSSITVFGGAGRFSVNFATPMPHANYATIATVAQNVDDPAAISAWERSSNKTAGNVEINVTYSTATNNGYANYAALNVVIIC